MRKTPAAVVRDGLKAYAERGIFQDFRETQARQGRTRFEFRLADAPVTVELGERDETLVVRNMLRQVPAGMYADLQRSWPRCSIATCLPTAASTGARPTCAS